MPDTKPDLTFDQHGVCSACIAFSDRPEVDWQAREAELEEIFSNYKSSETWDCIIPVSGGKDSTYQLVKALEYGMNPLAVTATTCDLSAVGRRNLENIARLGVDHVEFTSNRETRAKLNKVMLQRVGDISWPEHIAIFSVPVAVAVAYDVPLIVWGENSQNEYGGPASSQESRTLDRDWLEEFGGLLGQRLSDLVDEGLISEQEARVFRYPSDVDLQRVGVTGLFLGYFLPWDGYRNSLIATANGFESSPIPHGGGLLNYENLDNRQTAIHDYFKYLKYGFGRVTDHVCMQIRRGRLSRSEGLKIARKYDGRFPHQCIDDSLQNVLERIDISMREFDEVATNFTNPSIFMESTGGDFHRRKDGSPVKILEDTWGD